MNVRTAFAGRCLGLVVAGFSPSIATGLALAGYHTASHAAERADADSVHRAEVERLLTPLIEAKIVPGMAVGIYDKGKVEFYGLGVLAANDARTPDEHTLYEIGSISKVFTSMLLADAAADGTLKVSDPLEKWVPAGVTCPERSGKKITLEQLATHVSGLPRLPTNMTTAAASDPYATYSPAQLWEFLSSYTLPRDPGASYEYSNLGAGMLGQVLAERAKKPYATLLAERVTGPLGMKETVLTLSAEQAKRLAPPHSGGVAANNWTFDALAGAGGIRSTTSDLMKLVEATLHGDKSPFPAVIEEMRRPREVAGGPVPQMGLGWHYAGDRTTIFHNGQTGGYSGAVFIAPTLDRAVVVLANGADSAVDVAAEQLIQTLYGMKVKPQEFQKSIDLTEAQLDPLVGDYVFGAGPTMTVTREGTMLFAKLTGQPACRVFASSPTKFFYRVVKAELEFLEPDAAGKPAKVVLYQNGGKLPFVRKP